MLENIKTRDVVLGVITTVVGVLVLFMLKKSAVAFDALPGSGEGGASMFAPSFGGSQLPGPGGSAFEGGGMTLGDRTYNLGGGARGLGGGDMRPKNNGQCCCGDGSGEAAITLQPPISLLQAMPKMIPPNIDPPQYPPKQQKRCARVGLDFDAYVTENPMAWRAWTILPAKTRKQFKNRAEYGEYLYGLVQEGSRFTGAGGRELFPSTTDHPPTRCLEYEYV